MYAKTRFWTVASAAVILIALGSPDANAARKCLKFSDLPMNAQYTAPFVSDGVEILVRPFYINMGPCGPPTALNFVQVVPSGGVPGGSPPQELLIDQARLLFPTRYFFPGGKNIRRVKIKYRDIGGTVNLMVNGECYALNNFTDLPNGTIIGGVKYRRNAKRIILRRWPNFIDRIGIGGEQLRIDDVCAWR